MRNYRKEHRGNIPNMKKDNTGEAFGVNAADKLRNQVAAAKAKGN